MLKTAQFTGSLREYWDFGSVRRLCVAEGWYTSGTNEQYTKMLNFVDDNEPTMENLILAATDIYLHSESHDGWTEQEEIENVLYLLINKAVTRSITLYNK